MPIAKHSKAALEFFGLHIKPVGGKIPAFLTEFLNRNLILILALLAILLFFDLPFDRQTVTVPAGNIISILAKHRLRAVDHIFQDFIQRVANMKLAICRVGRHEG